MSKYALKVETGERERGRAMEESQEILLKSMQGCGVLIPPSVSSVKDLTPTTLVSISAQCLNRIDEKASFPTSLPTNSVADRVRICTDIASAVKNLGYVGDISFHKVHDDFGPMLEFDV